MGIGEGKVNKQIHNQRKQITRRRWVQGAEAITDFTITLDKIPISNNKFLRMHWAKRHLDKIEWSNLLLPHYRIRNAVRGNKIELTIVVYRVKLQDPDNAVACLKPLIDALKEMNFLVDDNNEWLILKSSQEQVKSSSHARTVITLRIVKGGNLMEIRVCKIFGSDEIFFEMYVSENEISAKCKDIWDNSDKYSDYKSGTDTAYYKFLKFLWVRFPDGTEKQLAEIAS